MRILALLLTIIFIFSLLLWPRYLYIHSLKKHDDRKYFFLTIKKMIPFIPIGLQGIFIFCYAFFKTFPICYQMCSLLEKMITGKIETNIADFYALKIIITGSLLVAGNLYLAKLSTMQKNKSTAFVYKLFITIIGLLFLNNLMSNMRYEIFEQTNFETTISYNNNFLFFISFLSLVIFAFINGIWIYRHQYVSVNYFTIASRLVMIYLSFIFLIAIVALSVTLIAKDNYP